jgi:hypothetical protein
MLDSLVRVSRRAVGGHYASIRADAYLSPGGRIVPGAVTLRGATFPGPLSGQPN